MSDLFDWFSKEPEVQKVIGNESFQIVIDKVGSNAVTLTYKLVGTDGVPIYMKTEKLAPGSCITWDAPQIL